MGPKNFYCNQIVTLTGFTVADRACTICEYLAICRYENRQAGAKVEAISPFSSHTVFCHRKHSCIALIKAEILNLVRVKGFPDVMGEFIMLVASVSIWRPQRGEV